MVSTKNSEPKLYDFSVNSIDGTPLDMNQFRGKVVLISNVASKCGYADASYKGFANLLNKYADQGLEVVLFPCNQFMNQESGDSVCIRGNADHYHSKFILTEKVKVNGSQTHPLFAWLKERAPGFLVNTIKWNYAKFLVDREGRVHPHRFSTHDEPSKMEADIEKLLSQK